MLQLADHIPVRTSNILLAPTVRDQQMAVGAHAAQRGARLSTRCGAKAALSLASPKPHECRDRNVKNLASRCIAFRLFMYLKTSIDRADQHWRPIWLRSSRPTDRALLYRGPLFFLPSALSKHWGTILLPIRIRIHWICSWSALDLGSNQKGASIPCPSAPRLARSQPPWRLASTPSGSQKLKRNLGRQLSYGSRADEARREEASALANPREGHDGLHCCPRLSDEALLGKRLAVAKSRRSF
jgi:hypothetical protein